MKTKRQHLDEYERLAQKAIGISEQGKTFSPYQSRAQVLATLALAAATAAISAPVSDGEYSDI